jgi:TonB family protein
MRRSIALVFLFLGLPALGQQNAHPTLPVESEITAPVLLPYSMAIATPRHCEAFDGTVHFAASIDAAGLPHVAKALDASDSRLVAFATEFVNAQRFKPASIAGAPAAVPVELTVGLHTCAQHERHAAEDNFYRFTLRTHPLIALSVVAPTAAQEASLPTHSASALAEQIGGHIGAPVPLHIVDPQIPVSGKLPKHGLCLLAVTIDANGVPQDIRVARGLEPELDAYAIEAVKNWRFKPALRDGSAPVAVAGAVAATFEYLEKEPVAFAFFIPGAPQKILEANAHRSKPECKPELTNADEVVARYMPQSRVAGRVLVSLVIGTDGVPQNVHAVKGLDSSLDLETVAMVEHLRFKPVMLDENTPVPVGYTISIHYRGPVVSWRDLIGDNLGFLIFLL